MPSQPRRPTTSVLTSTTLPTRWTRETLTPLIALDELGQPFETATEADAATGEALTDDGTSAALSEGSETGETTEREVIPVPTLEPTPTPEVAAAVAPTPVPRRGWWRERRQRPRPGTSAADRHWHGAR